MKKPELTDEEFDRLLDEAKPDLKAMWKNSPPVTPERIEELKNKLEKIHPFLRELTPSQMESLLLRVLQEKPMDAFEITQRLERANFKLKKGGAGVVFGLLAKLESAGRLERREREGTDRMIVTYHLTEQGIKSLEHGKASAAQLEAWTQLVFSTA